MIFGNRLADSLRVTVIGGSGSGNDLEDCKRQFRAAWATLRAGLTPLSVALHPAHRLSPGFGRAGIYGSRSADNIKNGLGGPTRATRVGLSL